MSSTRRNTMVKLQISRLHWIRLQRTLKRRGEGCRESGAFLLAAPDGVVVKKFIAYDDLDPSCLDNGYIRFAGNGFARLWDLCRRLNLRVIADAHTHPSRWVGQSPSDKSNPMMPRRGHIAFIFPAYCSRLSGGFRGVGVYGYEGEGHWQFAKTKSLALKLLVV